MPRLSNPRVAVRAVLGTLLLVNLLAVWFVFNPPGGSVEQLGNQAITVQQEIGNLRQQIRRKKLLADRVAAARKSSETFRANWLYQTADGYSTLVTELNRAAKAAGIREREKGYTAEPVEGTDALQWLTISASYEGSYADLMQFINQIDRLERLLLIESLQASPIQGGQGLGITIKFLTLISQSPAQVASR